MDTNSATACQGTLQVCKVAGSGVVEGTNFSFSIAGTPVTVPAGPAPGGTCSTALTVPAVPTTITETIPSGTTLASVSTLPGAGLLISSDLAAGTATVAVNPGGQTIATFVDTIPPPPTTGFLQICKIAGSGVALGTNFTFSVAGTPVTVAAGPPACGVMQSGADASRRTGADFRDSANRYRNDGRLHLAQRGIADRKTIWLRARQRLRSLPGRRRLPPLPIP